MIRRNKDASADGNNARSRARRQMVEKQIKARGITDLRVLEAFNRVPRHEFVLPADTHAAYEDHPLPIGKGQTISQPYIVALMTELLAVGPADRVLEVGLGSGYQAAILAELSAEVFSLEVVEPLARITENRLRELGYTNIRIAVRDGYDGWIEEAPFDAIVVTAAPEKIPQTLINQLGDGGRMVVPVGRHLQELIFVEKQGGEVRTQKVADVRFVPMVERDSSS